MNEIQELKLQIQNQIKENLAIEIQKNEEKEASKKKLDIQQNKINDLESQLIEMQSKSQEQKLKLDEFNSLRQKELINQFTEQNQVMVKQLQEADVSFQNLSKRLQQANESNRAMEKQQSWQKIEIVSYQEQIEKLRAENSHLAEIEVSLSKHLKEQKSKNEELTQTIERSQHEIQWLEGLDVHVVLQKPQGGYGSSILDDKACTGLVEKHRRSPFNKSLVRGSSIHDHLEEFISKQPTVNSYAQSVGQARLIEKFISADQEQKKELKLLKKKFAEIEKSFSEKYSDWSHTVQ